MPGFQSIPLAVVGMAVHKSAHFSGGLLSNVYTFENLPHELNPTYHFCLQCSLSSVLMFGEVVSQEVDEGDNWS